MIKLTSDDLGKVANLLPFSLDWRDAFTPKECDGMPEALKPIFDIRPMTVSERKEWLKAIAAIGKAAKQNRLAMSYAIEHGKAEFQEVETDGDEAILKGILCDCVQIKRFYEIKGDEAHEYKGELQGLPEWCLNALGERLQEISTLNAADRSAFGS